jgi:hypothetical protein
LQAVADLRTAEPVQPQDEACWLEAQADPAAVADWRTARAGLPQEAAGWLEPLADPAAVAG